MVSELPLSANGLRSAESDPFGTSLVRAKDGDFAPLHLPFIDRHELEVSTPNEALWPALVQFLEGSPASPLACLFARLLGCQDWRPAGPRPLAVGSAIPGFLVREVQSGRLLVLAGGHRFARYQLTFELEAVGEGAARLSARTDADFPGLLGRLYRLLVISSGVHSLVTRIALGLVARRALRFAH